MNEDIRKIARELSHRDFKLWYILQYFGDLGCKQTCEEFGISKPGYYDGIQRARERVLPMDQGKRAHRVRKRVLEAIIHIPDEDLI